MKLEDRRSQAFNGSQRRSQLREKERRSQLWLETDTNLQMGDAGERLSDVLDQSQR